MGQPQLATAGPDLDGLVGDVVARRPEWHPRGVRSLLERALPLVGLDSLERVAITVSMDLNARTPAVILHRCQISADARRTKRELIAVERGFDPNNARHCGRPGCDCTHSENECLSGWLDDDEHLGAAFRCPTCWK